MLGQSVAIAQIAKVTELSRQTIYRIKDDPEGAEAALASRQLWPPKSASHSRWARRRWAFCCPARAAGFAKSSANVQGHHLRRKKHVAQAIAAALQERQSRVIEEISCLAFSNISDVLSAQSTYGNLGRLVGSENVYSIVLAKKVRQSINVLDLTGIAHVPPMRALR
jgi:hypothetical protein